MRLKYTALAAMAALFLMIAGAYAMPTQDQTAQPSTTTPAKQSKASKKKAATAAAANDTQAGATETKTEKKVEKAEKAGKLHQVTGEVTNVSNDSLTISAGRGAKKEDKTFALTDKTKKPADLANGQRVTVHFTTEAGKETATRIVAAKSSAKMSGEMASTEKPAKKHAKAPKAGAADTNPNP